MQCADGFPNGKSYPAKTTGIAFSQCHAERTITMTFFEMFDAAKAGFAKADASDLKGHMAIQIAVTEDGTGTFYVEATDGVLNVQPYDYRDNTASVTLPHSTLFALLRRETTLPEAVAMGQAVVEGCMESAAELFATVPAPKKAAAPAKKAVEEEAKAAPVKETVKEETKTVPVKEAVKEETKTDPVKETVKEETKTTPAKETVKEETPAAKAATTAAKTTAGTTTTKSQPKRSCGRRKTK